MFLIIVSLWSNLEGNVTLRKETIVYKAVIRREERQGETSGNPFDIDVLVHKYFTPIWFTVLGSKE